MKKVELAQTVLNQQELIFFATGGQQKQAVNSILTYYYLFQLIANLLGNIVYY